MKQYTTNLTKRWIFAVLDVQLRRLYPFVYTFFYIYFKSRSRDPWPTPFDLFFYNFIVSALGGQCACQIWSFYLPRYGGVRKFKSRSRDPFPTPVDVIIFFSLVSPVYNLRAKFEVSSSNRSRNMEGSQNFKSRSRDAFPTPLTYFYFFFVSAPGGHFACQIWSF